jgi:hypothetical protein
MKLDVLNYFCLVQLGLELGEDSAKMNWAIFAFGDQNIAFAGRDGPLCGIGLAAFPFPSSLRQAEKKYGKP